MSQRKSIWEIRFYSLLYRLELERDFIQKDAADVVLKNSPADEKMLKTRKEQIDSLIKKAKKIETEPARYLWIGER